MTQIFDKDSMEEMLKISNLQFISSGVLYVNDPFFITRWNVKEANFISTLSFSQLEQESFNLNIGNEMMPESWNHFGFHQSFSRHDEMYAPYHRNNHLELHYVSKGEFKLKVNQTIVTLNEGDICLINPHCYHSDILLQTDNELELYILGINKESIVNYNDVMKPYPVFNNSFLKGNSISEYLLIRDCNLTDEIKYLEDNIQKIKEDNILSLVEKLYEYDFKVFIEDSTSRNTMLFEEIDNFIHLNYKTVVLDDLEFIFNFSKDYISRIIKKETDLTFNKYVQKIRINKAKELLLETSLSIKNIINEVGYENESHFYQLFRNHVGCTPNEYRKPE